MFEQSAPANPPSSGPQRLSVIAGKMNLEKGELVEIDGLLAVVVGIDTDLDVPDDHVLIWFGDPKTKRISEGGTGGAKPELWIVPTDYCSAATKPVIKH